MNLQDINKCLAYRLMPAVISSLFIINIVFFITNPLTVSSFIGVILGWFGFIGAEYLWIKGNE